MLAMTALLLAAAAHSGGAWTYSTKMDALTDKRVSMALSRQGAYAIGVRCTGGELEAFVTATGFINAGEPEVTYRFDAMPAVTQDWSASGAANGVFADDPRDFAESLITSSKMIFEMRDFQNAGWRFNLALAGAGEPIKKVLAQCPKEPAPPPSPPPAPVVQAPAASVPTRASIITQPEWARRPSAEEINRHFPDRALRLEKAGRATLRCKVKVDGTLEDCAVVSETPADLQFGKAALEMAPLFRMEPESRDGEPVGGKSITIPVVFPLG